MPPSRALWIGSAVVVGGAVALLVARAAEASPLPLVSGDTVLRLGDTPIILSVRRWRSSPLVFLNLHENESTSVDAASSVLASSANGGILVMLKHGGDRFINYTVNGRSYTLDPNRIFTDVGAYQTVVPQDEGHPAAVSAARSFAKTLLRYLPHDRLVALHNNSTGEPLTIGSYAPGGPLASDSNGMPHVDPRESPDDFFLVTTRALFNGLASRRFNVVLQGPDVRDDGSLSVYYARIGSSYVNVEAEHGALERQKRMIRGVLEVVR